MKREIITINEAGVITVPARVQMRDFEIAELFDATLPAVKKHLKSILNSGIAEGDISCGGTLIGNRVMPEYFGVDMATAIAFRVQSPKAQIFREWIINQTKRQQPLKYKQPIVIQIGKSSFLN